MKLNLECGNGLRNGYVNVSGRPIPDPPEDLPENTYIAFGKFYDLDPLAKDNTVNEIVFNPPLNVLPPETITEVLDHWNKKLTKNGVLRFSFIDFYLLARKFEAGDIDLQNGHMVVFGQNYSNKSLLDTSLIKTALPSLSYKVDFISTKDMFVIIEASKTDAA
jgi:hypothetical protein